MAKFITVICKVKGETILNLNDLSDIASNINSNFNNNYKTINVFNNCDKDIIIDRKIESNNNSNNNSIECRPQCDEVKDELESMDEELAKALELSNELDTNRVNKVTNDGNELMISGNSQLNKSNDSIKSIEKYCETIKKEGQMWHHCRYYECTYRTIWSNAIICHIRSHTGEKPYVCQYPNCGKSFSISCNLRNHAKGVHSNRGIARVNSVNRSYARSGRKKKKRNKNTRAVIASKYAVNANNAVNYCDNNKQKESLVDNNKSSAISNCLPDKVSYKNQLLHQMPARKSYFMHTAVKSVSNFGIKQTPKPVDTNINVTSITNDINNKQNEKQAKPLISLSDANNDKPSSEKETIRKANTSLEEQLLEALDENNQSLDFETSFESIRVVSSHLKTTKKNGKLWRVCQFPNCNYGSNLVSSLIHHVRTHTGERPFKCPYSNCDKSFTIKTNLNNHIKVHKGVDRASRL